MESTNYVLSFIRTHTNKPSNKFAHANIMRNKLEFGNAAHKVATCMLNVR